MPPYPGPSRCSWTRGSSSSGSSPTRRDPAEARPGDQRGVRLRAGHRVLGDPYPRGCPRPGEQETPVDRGRHEPRRANARGPHPAHHRLLGTTPGDGGANPRAVRGRRPCRPRHRRPRARHDHQLFPARRLERGADRRRRAQPLRPPRAAGGQRHRQGESRRPAGAGTAGPRPALRGVRRGDSLRPEARRPLHRRRAQFRGGAGSPEDLHARAEALPLRGPGVPGSARGAAGRRAAVQGGVVGEQPQRSVRRSCHFTVPWS